MNQKINHPCVVESSGGGMCPVQYFGTLCDGRVFYFRFRHGVARIQLGPKGTELNELPLVNPLFNWEDASRAHEAGEEYPHILFADPLAYVDVCGDADPYRGFFLTDEERDEAFAGCLHQIYEKEILDDHTSTHDHGQVGVNGPIAK